MLKYILFVFLVAFTFNAQGTPAVVIEELKLKLDQIKTLSGRFEQTIKDTKGQDVQSPSQGQFTMKRPGFFVWDSEGDAAQLVIGSPKTLQIYDADLEQLTTYPRGTDDHSNPAHLLSGDLTALKSTFTAYRVEPKKSLSVYRLEPISGDASFKQIFFHFKKNTLVELDFMDKLDQTTRIVFSQLQVNEAVSESVFDFTPPEGTDIIINE